MPAVFVNGVFESTAIWNPLLAKLRRTDVVLLPPPGFGAPLPLAQVFQTPGDVEKLVEDWMDGTLNERTKRIAERGIRRKLAKLLAASQGPEMRRAVLACSRSAVQPVMAELGRTLPSAAEQPGLAMIPTEDEFAGPMEMRLRSAVRAGASVEILVGLGHWWMDQGPVRSARALNSFWAETRVLVH